MIQLVHVTHSYRSPRGEPIVALDDVSVRVEPGCFTALKGPSGCGKSTLLLITGALLRPASGRVLVADAEPYALPADVRAGFRAQSIGFVFQQFHLIPYLDVLDNVMVPSLATGEANEERAVDLLGQLNLLPRLHHVPAKLSTGERQRVALARALYNRPKILLADEPTGNLDAENAQIVLSSLSTFAETGGSVLMVSHDDQAVRFADKVILMNHGKLSYDS